MAQYSNEQLNDIKEYAKLFFTPKEIALIQGLPEVEFRQDCDEEGSPAYNAFMGGRLLSEAELRQSIIALSKQGSSPAQTMAMDMLKDSQLKMIDR